MASVNRMWETFILRSRAAEAVAAASSAPVAVALDADEPRAS